MVPEPMTVNICEHDKAEVACPAGKKIDMKKAVYGRSDKGTCTRNYRPGSNALKKTDCARDVAAKIRAE